MNDFRIVKIEGKEHPYMVQRRKKFLGIPYWSTISNESYDAFVEAELAISNYVLNKQ